jgi:hypothetical protein
MPREPYQVADGWPHKHLKENPEEVHIAARTAYFMRDGKLMALPLETLEVSDVNEADEKLEAIGVIWHLEPQ